MEKEYLKLNIKDITPYGNNPRHNDGAVAAVKESIKQCGYVAPIIVDEDNIILAGHTRHKALKSLKRTEVEVLRISGLTDEQKRKYRLLDNKTNELAEWDFDLLGAELEGLDFDGFDFGFELPDMGEDTEIIEDEAPEVNETEPPTAKLGDVWQLGKHRLMCGDSTILDNVKKLTGGEEVDLLLTDPPYNVNYGNVRDVSEAVKLRKRTDGLLIENDNMDDASFRQFLIDAFMNANEVMKPGAVFYIWHSDGEGYNFRGACRDVGWKVRECLIWNKNTFCMGRQDYQWKHEPCLYGWKDGAGHLWASDRKQTTVINFDKPSKSELHPTMKPIALFDYQIKNNTKGGDLVLDLFGGSGTTIMACEQNGRRACVMEYDPKYVDVIIKRWEQFTGEKAVLLNE